MHRTMKKVKKKDENEGHYDIIFTPFNILCIAIIIAIIGYLIYATSTINIIYSQYLNQVPSIVGNKQNTLQIPVSIRSKLNTPMAGILVQASTNMGSVSGCTTDKDGNCYVDFIPPFISSASYATVNVNAKELTQSISIHIDPDPTDKLSLQAQSSSLLADGSSSTMITIFAYDSNGLAVPDGTPISFTLSSQGTGGAISANSCLTTNGRCQVTFTASTTPGVATFQAISYNAVNSLQITLNPVYDLKVDFSATPQIGNPVVPAFALNYNYIGESITAITITNSGFGTFTGIVQLSIPGWSDTVSQNINLGPSGSTTIKLNPNLNNQAFSNVQAQPANYQLIIQNSKGQTVYQKTYATTITSFNTMNWGINDDIIAAWVQPNAPGVHQLLSQAAYSLPGKAMVGYVGTYPSGCGYFGLSSCSQEETTYLQLKAIYNQLQTDGMHYVNAYQDFSGAQTVYTPAQSLQDGGANCIDGTLVFASAVSSTGMRPYIVLVPGHAFVCVLTYYNSGVVDCVETTMIGGGSTFSQALSAGNSEYSHYLSQGQLRLIDVNTVLSSEVKSLPS